MNDNRIQATVSVTADGTITINDVQHWQWLNGLGVCTDPTTGREQNHSDEYEVSQMQTRLLDRVERALPKGYMIMEDLKVHPVGTIRRIGEGLMEGPTELDLSVIQAAVRGINVATQVLEDPSLLR
ncbi:MAG: hypothetical protein Q4D89_03845 [Arachnia propionica]|uniref:hypothetical protein n=1 Tax=Arachnia propionica TaxID=1750 RepID=UPI0026F8CE22|nr:hypothetical protein [Arachnia propionica]